MSKKGNTMTPEEEVLLNRAIAAENKVECYRQAVGAVPRPAGSNLTAEQAFRKLMEMFKGHPGFAGWMNDLLSAFVFDKENSLPVKNGTENEKRE